MPSLREALQGAGYLQPLAEGIQRLLKKDKNDENQQQYNSLMQNALDSLRKTYSTQPEDNITWNSEAPIPPPQSTLGEKLLAPKSNKMDMSDDPGNITGVNVKPKAPDINIDQPDFQTLGDVAGRKYGDSEDKQRMAQDQILADFMMKAGNLKNLDPEKLKQGIELIKQQGKAYTPKEPKIKHVQFDPYKPTYTEDEHGNLKLEIPAEKKPVVDKTKSLGSYLGSDGYHHLMLIDNSGNMKDVKSDFKVKPPKGTVINFKPPKSEKWRDFGTYINSIDYKEDPETGKIVPTTPEERKVAREIAKNKALGNMLPRAINWYNTEIKNKWGAENISMADFEKEIQESYEAGELSPDEAQDLLDMNQYRPYLFDMLRETARNVEGVEK